jgi:hypothetical protein
MTLDDLVHLRLFVQDSFSKLMCKPLEDHRPLFTTGRNLLELRTIEEISQHLAFPGVTLNIIDQRSHFFRYQKLFT